MRGTDGADRFVLVSTDKAANPKNLLGQSKTVCEWIVEAYGHRQDVPTRFVAVRFGNVLNSSGSVIPIFRRQIEKGGPVTVTHPEIKRYFMLIPEAVQLVLHVKNNLTSQTAAQLKIVAPKQLTLSTKGFKLCNATKLANGTPKVCPKGRRAASGLPRRRRTRATSTRSSRRRRGYSGTRLTSATTGAR